MSFSVLRVPDFYLYALRRIDPALHGKPVGIVEGEGRKAVVIQVSVEAKGVEPGFAVTLAMARCPGIILRARNQSAEDEAFKVLLAAGFTLSPRVEATGPDRCTVDLRGADASRIGAELRRRVVELQRAGLPAKAGAGPSPLLANLAAAEAEPVLVVDDASEFLRNLPIEAADPTRAQAEILKSWGIEKLGQLTALPKGDIGERLGTAGTELWERAAGQTIRVLRLTEPVRVFAAEWEYEPAIATMEPLVFKLQRYAERVAFELRGAGFVAEALVLALTLEDDTEYAREFRLPEPGARVDTWMRVLLSHLETVRTAAAVKAVTLLAKPARPEGRQEGLFETGLSDPASFWENLARLAAILGEGKVGTPVPADSHKPDDFLLGRPAETVPAPEPLALHPRRGGALRRFRPAWPVRVDLVEDKPVELCGEVHGTVRMVAGPWRRDGEWWRPGSWAVEVWQVELPGGVVYQLCRTGEGWFVEGVVD